MRALIISASMGAGHDGAARELQRRLECDGHDARVVDLLDAPPLRLGAVIRTCYMLQLRFVPWAYELTYRLWYWVGILIAPVTAFINGLTGRRIMQWIRDYEPDVVVSTYPLASLALGRRRQHGQLDVPVVTYITDFAVHPLLVHPGVDLHLCVHPQSAAKAAARVPGPVRAPGPLVSPPFSAAGPDRAEARRHVGLGPNERGVLIVAGSWGVGDVIDAFDRVAASGRYTPVAVCGRNDRLAATLIERDAGRVIGWTDEMPVLMRACDVLVQNAGGLTCMEAFASGMPVVTYRPIPGHGLENAADMERAGVAAYVRDPRDLVATLDDVTHGRRRTMTEASRAMFAGDAAADVVGLAAAADRAPVRVLARPRRSRVAVAAVAATAFYASFTLGVGVAAAHGVGVTRSEPRTKTVFVGVRLTDAEARDAGVRAAVARISASAVVDGELAREDPAAVGMLRADGIEVVNGGAGRRLRFGAARADDDVARSGHAIAKAGGTRPRLFVPARRLNGYDLVAARLAHQRVVVGSDEVRAGAAYVIDGRSAGTDALVAELDAVSARAHGATAPLSGL